MRRSLPPLLLLLAALGAGPASAQTRQPPVVFRGGPAHPMRHFSRARDASFFAPFYGDIGEAEAAAPPPPNVIVLAVAPPPAPLPPPAPASVETTPRGVTIFRGPEIFESRR